MMRPLSEIKNVDNWRFIGMDHDGKEHYCIVRKDDDGSFYMNSNTARFKDLAGWKPDAKGEQ